MNKGLLKGEKLEMRKSNLVKAITCFMAATMAVTYVPSANVTNGVSIVAQAEEVVTPVKVFNFDGTVANNSYTENGITFKFEGDSVIKENPDDKTKKVLYTGTSYIITDAGALSDVDFSNGFSISLDIRPDTQFSDWDYVFAIGCNGSEDTINGWNYLDGTIGFIQRVGDPYEAYFPGDGWVNGNKIGGSADNNLYNYFQNGDNCNKWYNLTYVFAKNKVSIYLDGVLTIQHTPVALTETDFGNVLKKISNGKFSLGCGIDPNLEHTPAYYTNVKIFNAALTDSQVTASLSATAPDTTAPDTTAPDTTAPDTTAPDTTAPDTTAPDTTAPDTTAPDTTAPDTTAPDTTAPDTTAPVDDNEDNEPEETEPTLSKKKLTVKVGKSKTLKVNDAEGTVKWSSNKKKVAKVNKNGKITGVKAGKATITAKVDGKTLKCKVTVKK